MAVPKLKVLKTNEFTKPNVSFAERLDDHNKIIDGFLDVHVLQNHSVSYIDSQRHIVKGYFEHQQVDDPTHPDGFRQLFIWEAMEPFYGRQRVIGFVKGLVDMGLKPSTITRYAGAIEGLFDYVMRWQYIPSTTKQSIVAKYGPIEQPVLDCDRPTHILDHEQEGFALTGEKLARFYQFVWSDYVQHNQKEAVAYRNFTMVVVAGESGLRISEIIYLDALPPHRDLFYEHNAIQTRYGKAAKGSGKRTRKTIFTPFAQDTLRAYEADIRPLFLNASTEPALFLSEWGQRVSYSRMSRTIQDIVAQAREAGVDMPLRLTWHDLRRSFATNFLEQNLGDIWVLMDMMGHMNPSTLHRYVRHERSYFDRARNSIVRSMLKQDG